MAEERKMKRKFISFTDKELNILADALEEYGAPNLLGQIEQEVKERERSRKRHEEWLKSQPKIYCC